FVHNKIPVSECIISETGIYTNCGRGSIKYTLRKFQNSSNQPNITYPSLDLSPQAKSLLDSSFSLDSSNVVAGAKASGYASKGGGSGVSVSDISKPVSSFTSYFDKPISTGTSYSIPKRTGTAEGSKDDTKPPVIGTHTGGSVSGGSANTGTHTGAGSGSGSNTSTDTATGAGATGEKAGEVAGSNSQTNTAVAEGTTTSAEDEKDDLPEIPVVGDILKPLIDWRNQLLSGLHINPISGTCPVISIQVFDSAINIDAHCQVFEQLAGIISAMMIAVWSFLTFRVLFSA
ncbi:hypothetical protein Q7467_08275, partial [Glaesserella parasuis]|nr:hypothetical protein [Glaesserella parasuis]